MKLSASNPPTTLVLLLLSWLAILATAEPVRGQAPKQSFEPASPEAAQTLNESSEVARAYRRRTLDRIEASDRLRFRGAHISLSLKDADLKEVLRSFARLADVNLVIDPAVEGKVSVELHDVPWDQALYVILKSNGIAAELDGRVWRVQK